MSVLVQNPAYSIVRIHRKIRALEGMLWAFALDGIRRSSFVHRAAHQIAPVLGELVPLRGAFRLELEHLVERLDPLRRILGHYSGWSTGLTSRECPMRSEGKIQI
jgi:hypothetical protein